MVSGNRQTEWRLTSTDDLGCGVSQTRDGMIGTAMIGHTCFGSFNDELEETDGKNEAYSIWWPTMQDDEVLVGLSKL